MKKKIDISSKQLTRLLVLFTALRIFIAGRQMIFALPGSAPIDDDLYFAWAQSISRGEWLGEYNYLTLSKYPFFAVLLAFIHFVKIPYLIANCIPWLLAGFVAMKAFGPVLRTRLGRLGVYLAVVYAPSTWAMHTLRVYRDSFFPIICSIFFFSVAGWALRIKDEVIKGLPYMALASVSAALSYITREDGYWLAPFGITAFLICAVYVWKDRELENKVIRLVPAVLPVLATALAVITICNINNKYYGTFTLSDFTSGAFADCYGRMTRLSHEEWDPLVAVPSDVREKLYRESDTFASFREELEEGLPKKAFMRSSKGDYLSGSFYWALRLAAQDLGYYKDRGSTAALWVKLAEEVNAAADRDPGRLGERHSVTPPLRKEYVGPVVSTALESIKYVFSLKDMERYEDTISDVTTGRLEKIEDYLHSKSNYAAVEYSDFPYYTPGQKVVFGLCGAITLLFRLILTPLFAASLIGAALGFIRFRKLDFKKQLLCFIVLGYTLMALFRVFIISFMEEAAFDIGIYSMYLSCVYPLVFICAALAGAFWLPDPDEEERE